MKAPKERLIVRLETQKVESDGGFIIPTSHALEDVVKATVTSIGKDVVSVYEGDTVYILRGAGYDLNEHEQTVFKSIQEAEVLAIEASK